MVRVFLILRKWYFPHKKGGVGKKVFFLRKGGIAYFHIYLPFVMLSFSVLVGNKTTSCELNLTSCYKGVFNF